jgi:hypothetical protein
MNEDFITAEAHARIATILGDAEAHRLLGARRVNRAALPGRLRKAISRSLHALAERVSG